MSRTVTITIILPDDPLHDEEDVKEAFRRGYGQWLALRREELSRVQARQRAEGPIVGTVMASDALRLGFSVRVHRQAGTFHPLPGSRQT